MELIEPTLTNTKKSRSCGLTRTGICLSSNIEWPMIYSYFFPSSYAQNVISQVGYGSALGVVASLIIGVVTVFYLIASKKMDDIA